MKVKVTLTINEEVLKFAKRYAAQSGSSLSSIVENHLKNLPQENNRTKNFPPAIQKLIGSVSLPDDFDYKNFLEENLQSKHE